MYKKAEILSFGVNKIEKNKFFPVNKVLFLKNMEILRMYQDLNRFILVKRTIILYWLLV